MSTGESERDRSELGGGRHALSLLRQTFAPELLAALDSPGDVSVRELLSRIPGLTRKQADNYVELAVALGAIEVSMRARAGHTKNLVLTEYGRGLRGVVSQIEHWFAHYPGPPGECTLATMVGQRALASKAEGWGNQIIWALEAEPAGAGRLVALLSELSGAEPWGLDTADRIRARIGWMRETRQIEPTTARGGRPLYAPSRWGRQSSAVVAGAIGLELKHRPPRSRPPSLRTIAFGLVQLAHLLELDSRWRGEVVSLKLDMDRAQKPVTFKFMISDRPGMWNFELDKEAELKISGSLAGFITGLSEPIPTALKVQGNMSLAVDLQAAAAKALLLRP